MNGSDLPDWLTTDDLDDPVRRMLGDGAAVETWTSRKLTGGTSDALGVWRVSGTAAIGDRTRSWSLIVKGWRAPAAGASPSSMTWPLREVELYRSGLLHDLPGGIAAPSCYGQTERADGSTWLWTEDVQHSAPGRWPLAQLASHARLLGRMNGVWVVERPLPVMPGLSRGWLRERVEAAAPFMAMYREVADQPLVRQVYPPAVMDAYLRMWAGRERAYAALERLPQTFCHMDAFPRNAFLRIGADGRNQTVMIDWAFAGIGALAEELTSPIVASVLFGEVALDDAPELQATALDAYITGLRDAGWRGDADEVRHGYALAATLRYGVGGVGRFMPILLDARTHPIVERVFGSAAEDAFTTGAAVQRWLAGLIPDV